MSAVSADVSGRYWEGSIQSLTVLMAVAVLLKRLTMGAMRWMPSSRRRITYR